jgi:hypothetical protein
MQTLFLCLSVLLLVPLIFASTQVVLVGDATTKACWSVSADGSVQTQIVSSIDATTVVASSTLNLGIAAQIDASGNFKNFIAFKSDGSGQVTIAVPTGISFGGSLSVNGHLLYFHDNVNKQIVVCDLTSLTKPVFRTLANITSLVTGTISAIFATTTDIYINTGLLVFKLDLTTNTISLFLTLTGLIPGVSASVTNNHVYLGVGSQIVQVDLTGQNLQTFSFTFSGTISFVSVWNSSTLLVIDSTLSVSLYDINANTAVKIVVGNGRRSTGVTSAKSSATVTASGGSSSPANRASSDLASWLF